ncbi:uncharacterized protein GLRG_11895 [Colletotrichum graminicola M1.001]|uniref:Uncharacterized protein n=1 Tax=Colletotrichum graminicola (strain M1.001 / M2 / FGSC 10212) TaxID=645133 RepID=E3R0X8_COLGM|nr:uncharacterized protein GLRG_11895 [Colletotrichum graminicola M1.001]EFQ36766.1 hypothetical protein GLRG_11895 [Colletotrichum graminicola M1.001]
MSPQKCLQQLLSCGSTYRRRGRFTPEEHKRITAAFASLSQNLGLIDPQTRTSSYFRHRVCQAFLRDIEQIGGRDLVVLCAAALGLTQIGKMTKGQRTELTDLIISRQSDIESAGLDLGSATITGTAGGGEKLIGLYPPTPRNLAVFSSQKAFVDTHAHLERGVFMALTSEECCFIPAGWLHTLYTTGSGPTAVLKWPTSECF